MLMSTLENSRVEHILFAVDDIIVTRHLDLDDCIKVMQEVETSNKVIHGFYLRLGKNIIHSYPKVPSKVPPLVAAKDNVFMWRFSEGGGDWGYPNSVDFILYKKEKVLSDISNLNFGSPNIFESEWAQIAYLDKDTYGLCYNHSKMVNVPANKVQSDTYTRHMNSFSPQELLQKFNKGLKINIGDFFNIKNTSPHHNHVYTFKKQEQA